MESGWIKHIIMSKETLLPLSLVFTLLGASMSYGVMYNKVDNLEQMVAIEREERRADYDEIKEQLSEIRSAIISDKLSEVDIDDSSLATLYATSH